MSYLLIPGGRCPLLLRLLDVQRHLDRRHARRLEHGVNFFEGQPRSLWEDKVRQNELDTVVDDIDHPNLVTELLNSNTDAVCLHSPCTALDQPIETHSLGTEWQRQDLNGVQVVHGGNQHSGEGLVEVDPKDSQRSGCGVSRDIELPGGDCSGKLEEDHGCEACEDQCSPPEFVDYERSYTGKHEVYGCGAKLDTKLLPRTLDSDGF